MTGRAQLLLSLFLTVLPAVMGLCAEQVQIDISSGFNSDNWCGPREYQEVRWYEQSNTTARSLAALQGNNTNGIGFYALSQANLMVGCSTNERYAIPPNWWYNNSLAWVTNREGSPVDGVITGLAGRIYHIASAHGNDTLPGNWLEVDDPFIPGNWPAERMPARPNAMSVASWHNMTEWQIPAATAMLDVAQQGRYRDINFVLGAWGSADGARNMQIRALYADGSSDALYAFPVDDPPLRHGPCLDDELADTNTAAFRPVWTFSRAFGGSSGATGAVVDYRGSFFEFVEPLALDPSRTLVGIVLEDVNPGLQWNARGLSLYAATATSGRPATRGTLFVVYGGSAGPLSAGRIWVDHTSTDTDPDGSPARPFPDIQSGLDAAAPGDTVTVRAGTYRGRVMLPSGEAGRPITLEAAPGHRVIASGAEPITGWQPYQGGIYSAVIDWRPTTLYVDARLQPLSREPNEGWWAAPQVEELVLIDPANLTGMVHDVTGADVYIWTQVGNTFYTCPVASLERPTGRLTVGRTSSWMTLTAGDKYYFKNQLSMIDRPGEWAVAEEGGQFRVYFYPVSTSDLARVEAPRVERDVINFTNKRHVRVRDIEVAFGEDDGFYGSTASDVEITGCTVHHNGHTGVAVRDSTDVLIAGNLVWWNEYGVTESYSSRLTIEENDIAFNGVDGLIVSWDSHDILVQRNYVHDHLLWGHPDNLQLYRDVTNARFIDNLLITGGQSIMMQETSNGVFRGNMIVGCGAYMLIFGHASAGDYAVHNNTLAFSGYGCMSLTWRDYDVTENVFMTGHTRPVYSVEGVSNYTGNRNLFWNAGGLADWTVLVSDGGWHDSLAAFQADTGQDLQSVQADPRFINAPVGYTVLDSSRLDDCTRDILYLRDSSHTLLPNDYVEINFDGRRRTVTAVNGEQITVAPGLDEKPTKGWLVADWGSNTNFTLDLRLRPDSPGYHLGADGGVVGSTIDIQAYKQGDFDGDGQRDVPAVPVELVP